MEKRTLREWMAYLDSVEREYTLAEVMAVMVFNQREYTRIMVEMVRELKNSGQYSEAMLGSLDLLASNIAAMNGLPYAASSEIRRAMAAERRVDERQAALTVPDAESARS